MKLSKKTVPKYEGVLTFSILGILIYIPLKILNFEFLYKSLGFILILLINIILYVIVKYIKNRRNKNGSNI